MRSENRTWKEMSCAQVKEVQHLANQRRPPPRWTVVPIASPWHLSGDGVGAGWLRSPWSAGWDHGKNRVLIANLSSDSLSLASTARYPGPSEMRVGWYLRGSRDLHRKAVIAVSIKRTADCDRGPCNPFWIKNEAVSYGAGHSARLPPVWPLSPLSFTLHTLARVFRPFTASFVVCKRARGSHWLCSHPPWS